MSKMFTRKSRLITIEIAIKTDYDSDDYVKWFNDLDMCVQKVAWKPQKWFIYFDPLPSKDTNTTLLKLCKMIRALPPAIRKAWDQAAHREFYAGYEVGDEPFCFTEHLSVETLKAAIALNAGIGFALYPAQPTNQDGFSKEQLRCKP